MQNRDISNCDIIQNDEQLMEEESLESSIDNDLGNNTRNTNDLGNNDEITENDSTVEDNDNQQSIVKDDEYFLNKIEELCANSMYLLDQNPGNVELFKVTNTLMDIIVDWRVTNGKQYSLYNIFNNNDFIYYISYNRYNSTLEKK